MFGNEKVSNSTALAPMLVAFPVAFYTSALLAYVGYAMTKDPFWFRVGVVTNLVGVGGAAVAAVPGFIDWALGIAADHPARKMSAEHMRLNAAALLVVAINGGVQCAHWTDLAADPGTAIALGAAGLALSLVAGSVGCKILRRERQGARAYGPLPKVSPPPRRRVSPTIESRKGFGPGAD